MYFNIFALSESKDSKRIREKFSRHQRISKCYNFVWLCVCGNRFMKIAENNCGFYGDIEFIYEQF